MVRYGWNVVWLLLGLVGAALPAGSEERLIESFDDDRGVALVTSTNAVVRTVRREDGRALEVEFAAGPRSRVEFRPGSGEWNWTGMAGVALDVYNPGTAGAAGFLSMQSVAADGRELTSRCPVPISGGQRISLKFFFDNHGAGPYWGMRGIPVYGPLSMGGPAVSAFEVNRARITSFEFYFLRPERSVLLIVDDLRVFTADSPLNALVPFPFIDRFGQYIHDDWPGKIKDESTFETHRREEAERLSAAPAVAGRDRFGGWADGPQLEATGWFRTERVDGRWWLVTPEGRLFFSLGVTSVMHGLPTFVEGRAHWFEDLPDPEGPLKEFYGYTGGTHSMADAIGGKGQDFRFYAANLKRKYGDDWQALWQGITYDRLPAWGFNTFGAWTRGDVLAHSPIPFTVIAGSGGVRNIEGSEGFWGKMRDVFDPGFVDSTNASIAGAVSPYADNPLCIGYFVDNELSWGSLAVGALASPPEQPCRQVFIDDLKQAYGTVEAVNAAWGTKAADWEDLRAPSSATAQCAEDCYAFEYKFARRYFDTIAGALRKHAPNQLYLGCRFATGPWKPAIYRACADVVDVFSINYYGAVIRPERWTGDYDLGKPILIGEFHFGALDRGMFHTGLVGADDQAGRAEAYARYVRSVAECPVFVGCHWFQYADEATTGRSMDGENFNIGLVSHADHPYYEMLEVMTRTNEAIYELHSGE